MPHTYHDYTVHFDQLLGKGGFCAVYKATDSNGKVVAMKVPLLAVGDDTWDPDTAFNKRFEREARIWSSLCDKKIPGVVEVYDHGIKPHPWLAMELMEGGTLAERMNKLSLDEKQALMKLLLQTLSVVHRLGIVHRDIKPENVLFTTSGVAKIADWGLAKALLTTKTATAVPQMSIPYAAPEQLSQKTYGGLDWQTDIYQFGAMFFEVLTGRHVFPGDDSVQTMYSIVKEVPEAPSLVSSDVPVYLDAIILKCLEKKKENRYRSLDVVLDRLENAGEAGVVKNIKNVKKIIKPKAPVPPTKEKACLSCGNLIATTNKQLRCYGCHEIFCQECEGWFRAERKRGEKPLCETCYGKEMKRRELDEQRNKELEEKRRKTLEEKRKQEEEQRRRALEKQRKRELEAKKSKELERLLTVETTPQNAVKKQQAWAQNQGIDVGFTSPTGIEFVLIPAGTFIMGGETGYDDSKPPHQVTLSKPFYLGKYPVTQAQWKSIMGKNPSIFKGDNRPVEQVSWNDCKEFIQKLNAREEGNTYRLPTEAEWEYACRAGTMTQFCFGDDGTMLSQYAWYNDNSERETHPVGQKKANAWDLYDMHGNVWEWCQDCYGVYTKHAVIDPRGPSSGSSRVYRGGSWYRNAGGCASAYRVSYDPSIRNGSLGFRLARDL